MTVRALRHIAWAACLLVDSAPAQVAPAGAVASTAQRVEISSHYDNAVGTSDAASQGVVRGERLTDLPLLRLSP